MSLSNKALLANVHIRVWSGKKVDARANSTVERTHATHGKVGNYSKKLLPDSMELANAINTAANIRAFFYKETLPWFSDGSRILSSKNYIDFTNEFNKHKANFDRAVNLFADSYLALKNSAKTSLGDLFIETEYPTLEAIRNSFSCEVNFLPLPDVQDFRTEISETEKAKFVATLQATEKQAMRECWDRLYNVVSKAASKLNDPKGKFHDSLIENITEMCQLLPKLNINDDPTLESMRQSVESIASNLEPKFIRDNTQARHNAANKLDDVLSKMSAFF